MQWVGKLSIRSHVLAAGGSTVSRAEPACAMDTMPHHTHTNTLTDMCTSTYIDTCIYRERQRERQRDRHMNTQRHHYTIILGWRERVRPGECVRDVKRTGSRAIGCPASVQTLAPVPSPVMSAAGRFRDMPSRVYVMHE